MIEKDILKFVQPLIFNKNQNLLEMGLDLFQEIFYDN